jgi:hypothetical protein
VVEVAVAAAAVEIQHLSIYKNLFEMISLKTGQKML